jgi:hypothetical protein
LHSHPLVNDDVPMPAPPHKLEVEADEPEYWPVGVPGSRTIEVMVRDPDYDGTALFKFGMVPTLGMRLVSFTAFSDQGFETALKDLPVSRWEKVARAAAERTLMATGPHGQHVAPEAMAEIIVNEKFPELAGATGGNALRRRNGLIHLAMMFQEYKRAEETGVENPAQVLAEQHSVSAATVRGWLHRARKEGLAPESTHPNAGPRTAS